MATMTPSNPQTQIQLEQTQQAYQAFLDVVQALSPIATDTNDYPQQIANLAMQSTAGKVFANCVSDWVAQFHQLWTVLGQITAQIEAQYQAMGGVENQNTELASRTLATSSANTTDGSAPTSFTPVTPAIQGTPSVPATQGTPAIPATPATPAVQGTPGMQAGISVEAPMAQAQSASPALPLDRIQAPQNGLRTVTPMPENRVQAT